VPLDCRYRSLETALDRDTKDPAIVGRCADSVPLLAAASGAGPRAAVPRIEDHASVARHAGAGAA
jgi:hypothetical protein